MSRAIALVVASGLLACRVQFHSNQGSAPSPSGGAEGGGDGGDRPTRGGEGTWAPTEPGGLTLGQLAGNYNVVIDHTADPGTRISAANECIRFAGHAREIGAGDAMAIDLTNTVGAHADTKPPPGAPTTVTLGKADGDCRAAIAPAQRELAANKTAEAAAAQAQDEKAFAPYRKALTGDKLATLTKLWRDYGGEIATRIVDRDCVSFGSPSALARARSWFVIATDSVETVRRDFYQAVWSVEKIEWKGDKLGRDVPNLHSGKGSDPPAAACR